MMGGALGLAVLASVAASRTSSLVGGGSSHVAALVGGYRAAFLLGAVFAVVAAAIGVSLIHAHAPVQAHGGDYEPEAA
jgi:ABC-type Co2+ transport system permease subunit